MSAHNFLTPKRNMKLPSLSISTNYTTSSSHYRPDSASYNPFVEHIESHSMRPKSSKLSSTLMKNIFIKLPNFI